MLKERCEFNPATGEASLTHHSGCPNEATLSVGANGQWHVCASCAEHPALKKRFKVRKPLRRIKT